MLMDMSNFDLTQKLYESTDSYCQMQILQTFLQREGMSYRIEDVSVEERLETLCRYAGNHQVWCVNHTLLIYHVIAGSNH